jgi:protein involved in polysaccharide export with SLBB domain
VKVQDGVSWSRRSGFSLDERERRREIDEAIATLRDLADSIENGEIKLGPGDVVTFEIDRGDPPSFGAW